MRSVICFALVPALVVSTLTITAPSVATASDVPAASARTQRISGPDRFATAIAIAQEYPPGVPVVYVATGTDFPDALSAAPAATVQGGPLLLTTRDALPDMVQAEIARLQPALIVVVGGAAAISEAVYAQLASLAPSIRRDSGADRFETSRAINLNAFPAGGTTSAFFATGADFPDALSAAAAAGATGSPVVLVGGGAETVSAETKALVASLGVTTASIVGGTAVVSTGIESSLTSVLGAGAVTRLAGEDRYATSSAVNRAFFDQAPTVYFSVGDGFADALAGAALAGRRGAPLYVVPRNCVPVFVAADLLAMGTSGRVLLGGTGALGAGVESSTPCAPPPVVAPAGFTRPFDTQVPMTSAFGPRVHPITKVATMHYGTDYSRAGIRGTPIRAIADGRLVAKNVSSSTSGAGNAVTISHVGGIRSVSMHMESATPFSVGDYVPAGTILGYVGSTGATTGPNLHLEVWVNGVAVDPQSFLAGVPLARSGP